MRVDDDTTRLAAPVNRRTNLTVVALAACAAVAAMSIVTWLRFDKPGDESQGHNWWVVAWLVAGTAYAVVGAGLVTRYGHRRLGGCLVVVGISALLLAVATQASFAASVDTGTEWATLGGTRDWAQPIAGGVLVALIPWELLATRRSPRFELIWWTTAALIVVVAVGTAASGQSDAGIDPVDIPTWLVAVSATAATGRLLFVWWWRRVDSDDPLPGWLAAGALAAWLAVVPEWLEFGPALQGGDTAGSLMLLATVPLLLVGAVVDAIRRRPGRFHGVAHEVIAWLVFAGAIVVVYTGVVAGFGLIVGKRGPTWLIVAATGLLALIAEPARRRIRDAADRLVWGARDDPLEVVRGVVEQVGADSGDELLPALVSSLQRDLRLDSVAIDVRTATGWHRQASRGPATTYRRVVDLEQHGEVVGRLIVGWEYGPQLRARDEHVLAELVGPLGLAVGWVRLAADLRRSSLAIVSAREEERKRLRRDLHDGLGPALTGVSLGLRTALRQLDRASGGAPPSTPHRLLAHSADEVDALVDEVKRIVRDLRPTALDQFGLIDAVVEFSRSLQDELDIELSMPNVPLELPAAVEVATYRIVTEALTNVVRHAQAARCWLTISAGATIDIDVVDDGVGFDEAVNDGVGWTAMRERASELGGTVKVARHIPHGTHLHVELPAVLP
jgi:signal transduction histidine kinase